LLLPRLTRAQLFVPQGGSSILTVDETVAAVREAVRLYYAYPAVSVDRLLPMTDDATGRVAPVLMTVRCGGRGVLSVGR
jgi:hypothetical protein